MPVEEMGPPPTGLAADEPSDCWEPERAIAGCTGGCLVDGAPGVGLPRL